jgi:coenzyme F420 hydrogenase subunit beta
VGVLEGSSGENTLIVRTDRGADLVKRAIQKGVLAVDEMPPEALAHLEEAAHNKKKRAIENLVESFGGFSEEGNCGYITAPASVIEKLRG